MGWMLGGELEWIVWEEEIGGKRTDKEEMGIWGLEIEEEGSKPVDWDRVAADLDKPVSADWGKPVD